MEANPLKLSQSRDKKVFKLISQLKRVQLHELASHTGYTPATLYRSLSRLLENHVIISTENKKHDINGGRPSLIYSINASLKFMVGIVIERRHYNIGIVDLQGKLLAVHEEVIVPDVTPERFINIVYRDYHALLDTLSIAPDRIMGIGVGIVGPLNVEEGKVLNPHNFGAQNWENVPLRDLLKTRFKKVVLIDYLAKVAALGEYWNRYSKTYANMAYVTVNIGIGCGLIVSGKVVRGHANIVDGLGHMVVYKDGNPCSCGKRGCVEAHAALPAIIEKLEMELSRHRDSALAQFAGKLDINIICDAMDQKDPLVKEVLLDAASTFATGLTNFMRIVELEAVLIGGELMRKSKSFFDMIADCVAKDPDPTIQEVKLIRIVDEKEKALSGAAMLLLEHYLQ